MMITFNDNEKKLKDDLNRDIALPAVVHERINDSLPHDRGTYGQTEKKTL